ncbi:hypothetical protein C8039_07300 [Halogeometricum sp. wsp3]|nr:hypothetical protein C8039_07300 [Halogeometricum sp. wsp3]
MVQIPSSQVGIVVSKTLILILGGLITYYSYQAYSRTKSPQHKWLTYGFGVVTLGAMTAAFSISLSAGFREELLPVIVFTSSSLTAIGRASSVLAVRSVASP